MMEVGMELTLGRFGDRRLQKGGPFFWGALLRSAVVRCGNGGLAATALARSGCSGFCAIRQ
jgi:hypothetical protein